MNIFVLFFVIASPALYGQVFQGVVYDAQTREPLPYANIGVRGKNIGGISDVSGRFAIDLTGGRSGDSVVVSYLGYQSQRYALEAIASNRSFSIRLQPLAKMLEAVVVVASPEIIRLGNDAKSRYYTGWGDFGSGKGRAIGLRIAAPSVALKVNAVVFHLHDNDFDSVRVRINLLEVNNNTVLPIGKEGR